MLFTNLLYKFFIDVLEVFNPEFLEAIDARPERKREKPQPPPHPPCAKTKLKREKNSQQTPASSSQAKRVPIGARAVHAAAVVQEEMRVAPHEEKEEEEHPLKKSRGSISNEQWKSLEWDVEKWKSILDAKGMDPQAQQQIFLLAQLGGQGKHQANQLLSKMIDPQFCKDNPSAWLNNSVRKARESIDERMS